jgi:hypothetical protein
MRHGRVRVIKAIATRSQSFCRAIEGPSSRSECGITLTLFSRSNLVPNLVTSYIKTTRLIRAVPKTMGSPRSSLSARSQKHDDAAKLDIAHEEQPSVLQKGVVAGDYSGASEKTDPAEIALVRKLDRYIMVRTVQQTVVPRFLTMSSLFSGPCTSSITLIAMRYLRPA